MHIPTQLHELVQRLAAAEFLERHHAFHLIDRQAPGSPDAAKAKLQLETARLLHNLVNAEEK